VKQLANCRTAAYRAFFVTLLSANKQKKLRMPLFLRIWTPSSPVGMQVPIAFSDTEAEVVGQPITILIPPELRDEEKEILEKLIAGRHVEHHETVRVTKTGKRFTQTLVSAR
jgi:hypothetical protein